MRLIASSLVLVAILAISSFAQWSASGTCLSTGPVGINTGSTQLVDKLTVGGNITVLNGNCFKSMGTTSAGYPANLTFSAASGAVDFWDGKQSYWFRIYNIGDPAVNFNANGDNWFDGASVKLGVGTRTPTANLEVKNSTSSIAFKTGSYAGDALYAESVRGNAGHFVGPVVINTVSGQVGNLTVDGTVSASRFETNNCYVNGTIKTKELVVTILNWPDYVFEASYKLPPLSEVKDSITLYKHLIGVPGIDQVLKKGANIGDQQALLLKKVEELTLYVIQLQDQINDLKKSK